LHLRLLRHAGPTAPAHGLFLVRVVYDTAFAPARVRPPRAALRPLVPALGRVLCSPRATETPRCHANMPARAEGLSSHLSRRSFPHPAAEASACRAGCGVRPSTWGRAPGRVQRGTEVASDAVLDILVKTPKGIKQAFAQDDPFIVEILTQGRVLYERDA